MTPPSSSRKAYRRAGAILVAGGKGSRFNGYKQLALLEGRSVLARSLAMLQSAKSISEIVLVLPRELAPADWGRALEGIDPPKLRAIAPGGTHRAESVAAGFACLRGRPDLDVVVVHDAARPLATPDLVDRAVEAARKHGASVVATAATDTVKHAPRGGVVRRTIPRSEVWLAQTPQGFRFEVLEKVLARLPRDASRVTDEASVAEHLPGVRVAVVDAPKSNLKITEPEDLQVAAALLRARDAGSGPPAGAVRVGHGFDLHRLVPGRPLILGGAAIPHDRGLLGHSDGDVLLHALTDALLAAVGAPDIGTLFSDRDPRWKGASSSRFLVEACRRVAAAGYAIGNVDLTLHAERPRISPHAGAIKSSIAASLGAEPDVVSLKAKTHEGLGEVGRGEAMAATALVLVRAR